MAIKTLYTAVGRFERRTNGCNRSCPIILLGGQEYMVDILSYSAPAILKNSAGDSTVTPKSLALDNLLPAFSPQTR